LSNLLGPLTLKKGDCLNIEFATNFHNPKQFADPFQFKPDRWNTYKPEGYIINKLITIDLNLFHSLQARETVLDSIWQLWNVRL
jgi:hypothetical protein